ncbi:MAG: hypothetical protein AB1796_09030 [Bacillota bacterium]
MKLTLKWPVVIITFLITLSIIYAANYWRQQNLVMEPLREQLLSLHIVEDVQIEGGREKNISVFLGQVPHLASAYQEILSVLQSRNEEGSSQITIIDRRNQYLSSIYEKIHFAIMEGERQGNYTKMNAEISLLLNEEDRLLDYSLTVDQERIYLQLIAEDAYLYEVIPIKNSSFVTQKAGR